MASSDFHKLLKYFNGPAIVAFFKTIYIKISCFNFRIKHLVNGAQFFYDNCVAGAATTVISHLTKM